VALLYFYLKNKSKKEKQAAIYESETRIAKKLHDELANDVYQTIAFAETQDLHNPVQKETLLDNLDKIYTRTRNISRENSAIGTGESYEMALKEMLSGFSSSRVQVIVKDISTIPWDKIAEEQKIALYRVLQELLVNMKKHSQGSFVVLRFEKIPKRYSCIIPIMVLVSLIPSPQKMVFAMWKPYSCYWRKYYFWP